MFPIESSPWPVAVRGYLRQNPDLRYGSELDTDMKHAIREHLAREQHGRCAYCERQIGDLAVSVIEHFHPRDLQNIGAGEPCRARLGEGRNTQIRVDFAQQNLLLSCDGHKARPVLHATCDRKKENAHVCADLDNPKQLSLGSGSIVHVTEGGELVAVRTPSDLTRTQQVIDDVLNLNDRSLIERRASVIIELKEEFNRRIRSQQPGGSNASVRRKFAAKLRELIEEKSYPSTRESFARLVEKRGQK